MTSLPTTVPTPTPTGYGARLGALLWHGVAQIIRPASHSRRAEAGRRWARRMVLLSAGAAAVILALMFLLDASEIAWMPPRGTAALWPLRIVTDFGKADYVIAALLALLVGLVALAPRTIGVNYAVLVGFAARVQYLLFSVLLSNAVGDLLKGMIGRARPFVGGAADAFAYSHFAWSEAYASFPSSHATTSCALAFAAAALWPRLRVAMSVYVIAIVGSRLVLLAHHPSDVAGGALLGVVGAMIVRYWFAARGVVFVIRADGGIVARTGASMRAVLRAARAALAI